MKNIFKNSWIILLSIGFFSGCINDSFDTPKFADCVNPGLTKTKTIADIYAIAKNPVETPPNKVPNTPTYTADDIIEGFVVSSDEGGNFYKSLYVQAIDGSMGFNLSIDEVNLYAKNFQPGKKVFLKLKGLAYANPTSFGIGLIFGATPTDRFAVNRIPTLEYPKYLVASCDIENEDAIVHKISLAQVADSYLNTLIEFDDVQFTGESSGETFDLIRTDDYDSSTFITENGSKIFTVRTSRYANFAGYKMATGKGKIRGVLTKYNSTYQIILRTERDVNMPNPRVDYHLPIGGTAIQYLETFSENFESYGTTSNGTIFPNYVNDAYKGGKYWNVASFSSNKYIQMTAYAFNSGGTNIAYLAIPIAFTAGKKLSFKTKDGFYNGEVLKVYYSKDYIPLGDIGKATLVDITSSFTIAKDTESGYASNFTNSGNYTIPSNLSGNGFFIFEYSTAGRPNVTSTIQIDDIIVK